MFQKDIGYFKEIEHTADVGLEVRGNTVDHLFANAAFGLYHLLFEGKDFKKVQTKTIQLQAENLSDLMVTWLGELNYILTVEHFVMAAFDTLVIDHDHTPVFLKASLAGQAEIDIKQYLRIEIKAITYHQLDIRETNCGYETRIFFDI
jgi:SHS2 domain-containing protein